MSFVIEFTIDHRLPKLDARELASRISGVTGLSFTAAGGWLTRTTNCFWTTDSGELFDGESDGLVPAPGVAEQLQKLLRELLGYSSVVTLRAGWIGDVARHSVDLDESAFMDQLAGGRLGKDVAYRIRSGQAG